MLCLVACLALVSAGCGQDLGATVSGTVALGEEMIDGGSITFYPLEGGPISSASIQSDGTYELTTASQDGIRPGSYIVTVLYRKGNPVPGMTLQQVNALNIAPTRYRDKSTSDLRFNVEPGENVIEVRLKNNR